MQIKNTMRYLYKITIKWLKSDRLTPLSVDKEVEKLETAYIIGGNIKWGSLFEKQFSSLLKS